MGSLTVNKGDTRGMVDDLMQQELLHLGRDDNIYSESEEEL